MADKHVGEQLEQNGWDQGSLLAADSARIARLIHHSERWPGADTGGGSRSVRSAGKWDVSEQPLEDAEYLVVVSQTCDVIKHPDREPDIQVARAFWTTDRARLHEAAKNSSRYFLLRRRTRPDGTVEGLVADACPLFPVEKGSLLDFTPQSPFEEADTKTPLKLRRWLGARFSRQPLPNELVNAVQRPIVRALDKLNATSELHGILDRIDHIFCEILNMGDLLDVEVLLVCDEPGEEASVSRRDAARVADWIDGVLRKDGRATLVRWDIYTSATISAYDYSHLYELSLEQYTLPDEDEVQETLKSTAHKSGGSGDGT